MRFTLYIMVFLLIGLASCGEAPAPIYNPPAEGFNATASDDTAIALADSVMEAMGGRRAWDSTRYISWEFLGVRSLVWDKLTGDVRVEGIGNDMVILVNIFDKTCRAWQDSAEITHPDSLLNWADFGEQIWVNDSYWLVMPYKLKDSGVTLKYLGKKQFTVGQRKGQPAHVLELLFDSVGFTPQNKYDVYVPVSGEKLIYQWDFYNAADEGVPGLSTTWEDWEQYGKIKLAGIHKREGDPLNLTKIAVHDTLPPEVFNSLGPVEF